MLVSYCKKLLLPNIKETFTRFPLPTLCAITLTILVFLIINNIASIRNFEQTGYLQIFCGFFTFSALKIFSENHKVNKIQDAILNIIALLLVIFVCLTGVQNLLLLLGGISLFFLSAPYIFNDRGENACCHFTNKVCEATLYSTVIAVTLCGGTSLILLSIHYLFNIHVTASLYLNIWLLGGCLFAPLYFLSSLPKEFGPQDTILKKGMSFLLSNILAPMLVIYCLILHVYIIKILLEFSLPKGRVVYMVCSFGIIGSFIRISLYPLKDSGNIFVKLAYRYFYHFLLAPIILLFIGLFVRISAYGVTPNRYIVALVGVWLLASTLYYIAFKTAKSKNIIILLSTLLIFSSFGFWGMESVSNKSQIARLEVLLIKNNILVDGKVKKIASDETSDISAVDMKDIQSIVNYISKNQKALRLMNPWFDQNISKYKLRSSILQALGLKPYNQYTRGGSQKEKFNFKIPYSSHNNALQDIAGFDKYVNLRSIYSFTQSENTQTLQDLTNPQKNLHLITSSNGTIKLHYINKNKTVTLDLVKLSKILQKKGLKNNIPLNKIHLLNIVKNDAGFRVKFSISKLNGYISDDNSTHISNVTLAISVKYPD